MPLNGPFPQEWKEAFDTISDDVEEVEISTAISQAALSTKDEGELRLQRDAAKASSSLLRKYFVDEMSEILDEEKKVTHKSLSSRVQAKIDDTNYMKGLKIKDLDPMQLDWAFNPTVQSGGTYDLKFSAESDDRNLHPGVIIASMGLRNNTYACQVARTYMVDPDKSQESNYKVLLAVHDAVIKRIKEGVTAKSVYEEAINVIKAKKPDLQSHFMKSVGYGIGIETRDKTLSLDSKSDRTLKDGMTLVVQTGFTDLDHPKPKDKRAAKYALALCDTVRVHADETAVFTRDAPGDLASISFFFADEEEEEKPEKSKGKKDSRIGAVASQNVTKTRLRHDRTTNQDAEKEAARRSHQKELHEKKQQAGLERYGADAGSLNGTEEKKFKRFESYKRGSDLPLRTKDLVICVDQKNSSLIVPVMGRPVPFHINTIRNASRNEEGDFTYLRINFLSPGQGVGRKDDQPFEDPNAHFVRSLTFRSKDSERMADITEQITELKKSSVRKEQEKKEMEDVIEQDKLQEIRGRRPHRMEPLYIRPGLEGKRLAGAVEIHQNGLKYMHPGGAKVDVLFSNVKHLFFQPCAHELIVLIHVHLVNPILIGKKKTKDVQFYREATEMAFDETGNRKRKHRYGDEEEFEQEQEERRRRAGLDKEFKNFAERVAESGRAENLSVDIPFRELGFTGVPSRSSVLIQPTTDCLVQLTEPPFLTITIADIEVVHLERVQYGLKNFDMVLIMKDFQRPPAHINTIPVESLDGVKDWLDSCDIPFSEGPLNLNWATIMKTVTADPHGFFADGGWSFLGTDSDEEGEEDEESAESAFEIDDEEVAGLSEESSDEDSDFDEEASADASGDDASDASDEGEDWDELEAKAKKSDRDGGMEGEDSRGKSGSKKKR